MWLYNFGLTLYVWLIRLVAPRHPKARLWIDGRKDLYKRMAETIDPTDRIVWVHVASLGEFEQGRPIIERIRKTHPEYKIDQVIIPDGDTKILENDRVILLSLLSDLSSTETLLKDTGRRSFFKK